jgi:hypothetical protein
MEIRRLVHPLSGSSEWTEMKGTTVNNKVWNGRANLATVEADGPSGHLELLALRLYDPRAQQWNISFATSHSAVLSVPAVGGFNDGRGEFYDSELFHGRNILVRFMIWPVSATEVHSEQAFSADGGNTWPQRHCVRLAGSPPSNPVYQPLDTGTSIGPSPLCRFHHNAMTHPLAESTCSSASQTPVHSALPSAESWCVSATPRSDAGEFFAAHEAWESRWLESQEPEKTFLQGLIQLTAAFHHFQRNNPLGATRLLQAAPSLLEPYRRPSEAFQPSCCVTIFGSGYKHSTRTNRLSD